MFVLSNSDIERMKSRMDLSSPIPPEETQRKEQLKEMSDKRVSKWNNTLAAQHASRLEWKARKKEEKERRWQEIDKEEAEIQEQLRLKTTQRAKTLLNEQRERVRLLRSQQMYQEVLETRTQQIAHMKRMKEEIEKKEALLHEQAIATVKKEEEEDQEAIKQQNMQARELARAMKESMEKKKIEKKARKEQQKKDEAEEMRKLEMEDRAMRQQVQSERVQAMNQAKLDYQKMKQIRIEEQEIVVWKEEEENKRRESELTRMLERKQSRILLERRHFERTEARKQLFYNKASQILEQRLIAEAERLQKEVAGIELMQKNQDENLNRAKREMNDALHKSRQEQIAEKARVQAEENAKEKLYIDHILKTDLEGKERLIKDAQLREQSKKSLRKLQEDQILEFKERRDREKVKELELQRQCSNWPTDDDAEFCQFAAEEIERLQSLGKETTLIERTLRCAADSKPKKKNQVT